MIECERFTNTISPAENGFTGVTVTVLLPFEKENAPAPAPLHWPDTRSVDAVTVAVFTARSKVTDTVVVGAAIAFSVGDVETTCIWPSAAIGATSVTSRIPMRDTAFPPVRRQPLTLAARVATANSPV